MTRTEFRNLLEDLLKVPRGSLRDEDTRETVPLWTSLADVQIMIALASELGLEDAEMLDYESVGDLMTALDGRGAFAA